MSFVVAILRNDQVTLASDSMTYISKGTSHTPLMPRPKILTVGTNLAFSAAGILESKHLGFNIWDIASKLQREQKPFFDLFELLIKQISEIALRGLVNLGKTRILFPEYEQEKHSLNSFSFTVTLPHRKLVIVHCILSAVSGHSSFST